MKITTKIGRMTTAKNVKLGGAILLALLSAFGIIKPETATELRNDVLVPIGIIADHTGDL